MVPLIILSNILLHVAIAEDAVIGDINLISRPPHYEVQIYFGDGLQSPSWAAICHDHAYNVDNVICRQLGYKGGRGFSASHTATPIKLLNVDCREMPDTNHILRCKYDVSQTSSDCSAALAITCDFDNPLSPYDGQVVLCPPQLVGIDNIRSTSFGVVGVRLHDKIMGISQPAVKSDEISQPLGGNEADAICRQLGYTEAIPGSVATKAAYETQQYTFNYCYSLHNSNHLPFGYIHNGSWLSTAQVQKCTNSKDPQNCFGCCYDYPPDDCKDTACVTNHNDVVIRCGFVPSKVTKQEGKSGSMESCKFNEDRKVNICENHESACARDHRDRARLIAAVVILALAICGLTICGCGFCCKDIIQYWKNRESAPENNPDESRPITREEHREE